MKRILLLILSILLLLTGCRSLPAPEKPVIYLYPEEEMTVEVKLDFSGSLTSTYPAYKDCWKVIAQPDGTLTDPETGKEYYCLFWEGVADTTTPSPPVLWWRARIRKLFWKKPWRSWD